MISLKKILFIFIFQLFLIGHSEQDRWSENQKLRQKLLKNYDKHSLPQRDVNGTTTVKCSLLPNVVSLDDEAQVFIFMGLLIADWHDKRLTWDTKEFGGLEQTHFGNEELWKPDLLLYNNAEGSKNDHYGSINFLVFNTGLVIWDPPVTLKVPCVTNIKFWPFDTQECLIIMGSWTTHGWQINLEIEHAENFPDFDILNNSGKWKLMKSRHKKEVNKFPNVTEPYITLRFYFTVKRNAPIFGAFVVIPAVVIPVILMIQFILPVDHSKRLIIGLACSILVLLELLFLKYVVPKIGSSTPLVVTYYSQCLVLVGLTIFLSAILGRLSHPTHPLLDFPPPEFIKVILKGPLAVVLCVSTHADKVGMTGQSSEDGQVLTDARVPNFSHEWLLLAKIVDRLSLILLTCIFVFSLVGYIAPVK